MPKLDFLLAMQLSLGHYWFGRDGGYNITNLLILFFSRSSLTWISEEEVIEDGFTQVNSESLMGSNACTSIISEPCI